MLKAIWYFWALLLVSCMYQKVSATHSRAYRAKVKQQAFARPLDHENFHVLPSAEELAEKDGTKSAGRREDVRGTLSERSRDARNGTRRSGVNGGRPPVVIKSCNANFCDPGWEPYPNIVSAMTGYNILKGNAYNFGTEQDPGFDNGYIFVPVVKDDDDRYALHGGITVRAISKCDLTLKTKTVSTVKGYQNMNRGSDSSFDGWKTNPPIEFSAEAKGVSATVVYPPLFESYGTANNAQKENEEFFTKRQGVLTISDATCAMYSMQISRRYPPPFQQPFINAVKALSEANDEETKKKEFYEFIEDFGTHFLLKATVGARLSLLRRYHRNSFQKASSEEIENCSKDRLSFWFVKKQGTDKCKAVENANNVRIFNELQREYIVSYGSKPEKSLTEWACQKFEYPVPIKMTLVPIIDLFHDDFMKNDNDLKDTGYNEMRAWMEPLYKNYCETMKSALGVEQCNPGSIKRCGYNDDCNAAFEDCYENGNNEVKCRTKMSKDAIQQKLNTVMNKITESMKADDVAELIDNSDVGNLHGAETYVFVMNQDYGHLEAVGDNALKVQKKSFKVAFAWASVTTTGGRKEFEKDVEPLIGDQKSCNIGRVSTSMEQVIESINVKGYSVKFMISATDDEHLDVDKSAIGGTLPDYFRIRNCERTTQSFMIGPGRKLT